MTINLLKIKEFPADTAYWRLHWFGGVRFNPLVPSDPTIDLLLKRLAPGQEQEQLNTSCCAAGAHHVARVGISVLPYLSIGSLWHRKRPLAAAEEARHTVLFHTSLSRIVNLKDCIGKSVLPSTCYGFEGLEELSLDTLLVAVTRGSDRWALLIPCMELARFYAATSSRLARALFWCSFEKSYNSNKSGPLENGLFRIQLRKFMKTEDCWTLARFAASEKMQQVVLNFYMARRLHSIQMQMFTKACQGLPFTFPFDGETSITGTGIALPPKDEGGEPRFLMLRMLHCTGPFPYSNVIPYLDNNAQKGMNSDDPNLLPAWAGTKQRPRVPEPSELPDDQASDNDNLMQVLCSDAEPSMAYMPLEIEFPEHRFAALSGKHWVKSRKEQQHYRNAAFVGGRPAELLDGFSTGEGTWGTSPRYPANLSTTQPDGAQGKPTKAGLPASLKTFFAAIKAIQSACTNLVRFTTFNEGQAIHSEAPSCMSFPQHEHGIAGKPLPWSLVDDGETRRARRLAVVEVVANNRSCYVLEIERSVSRDETFSVLIMARRDFAMISHFEWIEFLLECARIGRWPSSSSTQDFIRLKTTHKDMTSTAVLSARIVQQIKSLIGSLSETSGLHEISTTNDVPTLERTEGNDTVEFSIPLPHK